MGQRLEYQKDGKTITCSAVKTGNIGQLVILGSNSYWTGSPFAKYPLYSVFTITEKNRMKYERFPDNPNYDYDVYVLQDKDGHCITVRHCDCLYDPNEWIAWQIGHYEEKLRRKDHKIELQQAQIDILKSAIAGIRVITEDQLKALVGK